MLRIQPWWRYWWAQPRPTLHGNCEELVCWGVRVGIKVWAVVRAEFCPESLTQSCTVLPGSSESQSQFKIRENTMVRSKVLGRANRESEVI